MNVEYLLIPGMAADRDAQAISAALGALPGVLLVSVNLNDRRVRVEHAANIHLEELIRAINQAGYDQVAVLA